LDFDVVIQKKLLSFKNRENEIGTIIGGYRFYIDNFIISLLNISQDYLEKEKTEQRKGMT
jgi:predicted phosphoribosyltransferase